MKQQLPIRTGTVNEIICPHCDKAFKVDESETLYVLR